MRRHLAVRPWSDCVEVHWIDGAEAYGTPVGDDEIGIALLWTPERSGALGDRRPGFDEMVERFPRLIERLAERIGGAGDAWSSPLAGCGPLAQGARSVVRGRLALVGDAAGYLDAITGEGLAIAFHEAEALGTAMAAGDLRPYAAASRRIRRLPTAMTRLLLAVERRPWLRRRVIRALAADTGVFDRLLAIHARSAPPSSLGLGGAWRLAHALVAG
jgi:flavin-dependent dehydrogenase